MMSSSSPLTPLLTNNAIRELVLLPEEKELLDMFRKMAEDEKIGTTVRIAGGWVRDKLLGAEGKMDIDVALDNMTGAQFATKLNDWTRKRGGTTIQFGVIQQNPDKSKHLETATAHLGRFEIDFVNLRTEVYLNTSRVPEIRIGTPLEDAYRRDLTINSLFYNVNTGLVEDLTGKGVEDLKSGIVQTPLPALTTLRDDPLRALRAVRFACRFRFAIAHELLSACSEPSVHLALATKVSRERVYQEVEQMMRGQGAARASTLLYKLGLLPLVLTLPDPSIITCNAVSSPSSALDPSLVSNFHIRGLCVLLSTVALDDFLSTSSSSSAHYKYLRSLVDSTSSSSSSSSVSTVDSKQHEVSPTMIKFAALSSQGALLLVPNIKKKAATPMSLVEAILLQYVSLCIHAAYTHTQHLTNSHSYTHTHTRELTLTQTHHTSYAHMRMYARSANCECESRTWKW